MKRFLEEYGEYIMAFFIGMSVVGGIYSIFSVMTAATEKFLITLC